MFEASGPIMSDNSTNITLYVLCIIPLENAEERDLLRP